MAYRPPHLREAAAQGAGGALAHRSFVARSLSQPLISPSQTTVYASKRELVKLFNDLGHLIEELDDAVVDEGSSGSVYKNKLSSTLISLSSLILPIKTPSFVKEVMDIWDLLLTIGSNYEFSTAEVYNIGIFFLNAVSAKQVLLSSTNACAILSVMLTELNKPTYSEQSSASKVNDTSVSISMSTNTNTVSQIKALKTILSVLRVLMNDYSQLCLRHRITICRVMIEILRLPGRLQALNESESDLKTRNVDIMLTLHTALMMPEPAALVVNDTQSIEELPEGDKLSFRFLYFVLIMLILFRIL